MEGQTRGDDGFEYEVESGFEPGMQGRTPPSVSLSADDQMFAVALMWDAQRLTSLDDLWTSLLATPSMKADPQSNVALLVTMVGELVGSLANIAAHTVRLERLTERVTSEFRVDLDSELTNVLGRSALPMAEGVRPPRPFAVAVHEACQVLREETPREIADITAKLLRITEGEYEPGDWSRKVKRALLIVTAAAGVLAAITIPGAIVVPVLLSAGAGVVSVVAGSLVAWDSLPAT